SDKTYSTTHRHVVTVKSQKTNVPVPLEAATRKRDVAVAEYAIDTCPQGSQQRAKQLAHIPLIRKKQVTIAKPSDKTYSTTHRHVVTVKSQKTNVPVPLVKGNQENDKIGSKPDKNGKRGEAEKCQKQLQ
nr:hypothetical protein [Tanacetum cinerariifolium]